MSHFIIQKTIKTSEIGFGYRVRSELFSGGLEGGLRLVFEPAGDKADYMEGNSIRHERVVAVLLIEVIDYHD